MKKIPHAIVSSALLLTSASFAQNVWNGAGVGSNTGSDWTLGTNYTSTPTFNATTDLKFSTITSTGAGLTLSAGTGGTYAVKNLTFGEVATGLTAAENLTINGTGVAGATTIDLTGNILMPTFAGSIVTIGSDVTLNLTNAAHTVTITSGLASVLVVKGLVTGGGTSAALNNSAAAAALVFTNNNNDFVNGGITRFNGYVGYTSVGNIGSGASSIGSATNATTGLIYLSNQSVFDYIGVGNQTTDRALRFDGTASLNNSTTGTTLTFNGTFNPMGGAGSEVRSAVVSGSTVVLNSAITGIYGLRRQSATGYSVNGTATANDGLGTLILGGDNSYSGVSNLVVGLTKLNHANGLGSASGNTIIGSGATLDLNGMQNVAEPLNISGAGIGNNGALINSNTSTAASLTGAVTLAFTSSSIGGAGDLTINGAIGQSSAGRGLAKVGAGKLILTTATTYTGATVVSGGTLGGNTTLLGAASFASGTVLNPGVGAAAGVINFNANLTLSAGSTLSIFINQAAGSDFDRVAVTGTTGIGGSGLVLDFGSSFASSAVVGQTFNILTSTSTLTGQFTQGTSISATSDGNIYGFGISYAGNNVVLTLNSITPSAVPEPSTWALIFGGAALTAGVVARRRRQVSA